MKGTEFTADVYWAAATERAGSLQQLYDAGEFALALYVAGVAVESMFRAFRVLVNREAILKYLKRAGLDRRIKGDALKENARRSINAAINLVALGEQLWKT